MAGQVPDAVRRERLERVLDLQRAITLECNEAWVGRVVPALVDARVGRDSTATHHAAGARGAVGRTEGQALEVDGIVHIAEAGEARPGDFIDVRITDAVEYDLTGERADHAA
jgi:ribosomal protein S12 methylthiotransferase